MVPTANSNMTDQLNNPNYLLFKERGTYKSLSRLLKVKYITYKIKTNNTKTRNSKTTVASDKYAVKNTTYGHFLTTSKAHAQSRTNGDRNSCKVLLLDTRILQSFCYYLPILESYTTKI